MRSTAYRHIALLTGITLLLFFPLFYSHYFYTDEIVQLWYYRKGSSYHMFYAQGRYLTDILFSALFSSIDTIAGITWLHTFSLLGWILCLPVWYTIFARIAKKEELPAQLPFFAVLYLITSIPFTVYVSWAAVMELFIANTGGLIAGYLLYSSRRVLPMALALLLSMISLFTYQNGFCCFLLPFLLHLVARGSFSRLLLIGVVSYFLAVGLYYLLYKWEVHLLGITASSRSGLADDSEGKLHYFLRRPLASAFRFNWVTAEDSYTAKIVYMVTLGAFLLISFLPRAFRRPSTLPARLIYLVLVLALLVLMYLPTLVVKEYYASNRTLLALEMGVFLLVFITFARVIPSGQHNWIGWTLAFVLVVQSAYNFRSGFLRPVKHEYEAVRSYLDTNYHPGVTRVLFIRPPMDLFEKKYHLNASWDEIGVPCTAFEWVPEFFVRQVVLEKTGSRTVAEGMIIQNYPNRAAWQQAGAPTASANTLLVDVEDILK